MAATIYTYDPKAIRLNIAGEEISDFASGGTFISFAPNADFYTTQIGIQGNHTRSRQVDTSWTLELTLPQESPQNAILQALVDLGRVDIPGASDVVPVAIVDNGKAPAVQWFSPNAYLMRRPAHEFAAEAGTVTWSFMCPDVVITNLGSAIVPAASSLPSLS